MTFRHSLSYFTTNAIFVIALTACAAAQDTPPEKVSIPLNFQPGASADISYSITLSNNQTNAKVIVKATASMEIISTDQAEPLISWTLKSYDVEEELPDVSSPVIEKLFLDLPTQFIADKKGAPIRLHNPKSLVSKIVDRTKLPEFEDEDYKGFASILNEWINPTNKENAEFLDSISNFSTDFFNALFLEIPELISLCHGADLVIGEWEKHQEDFDTFGLTLKMNVQYQLASVDRENKLATIYFRTTSDKESQQQELAERRKGLNLPKLSEKEIDESLLHIEERAQCSVNTETGWIQNMDYGIQSFQSPNYEEKGYNIKVEWH